MIYRNFSQFDEWKPARLVWDAPGETPPAPATGETTPPSAEAKPDAPPAVDPAAAAAAAAAQAAEGERRQEAITAGQPNPEEADNFLLAALSINVPTGVPSQETPPTAEKMQDIYTRYNPLLKDFFGEVIEIYNSTENVSEVQQKMAELVAVVRELEAKIPPEDRKVIAWILLAPPTQEEQQNFEKKYIGTDKKLKTHELIPLLADQELNLQKIREIRVVMSYVQTHMDEFSYSIAKANPAMSASLTRIAERSRDMHQTLQAQLGSEVLAKYKNQFDAYLAAQDPVKAKETLLASVEAKDRDTVRRLIESDPTKKEQDDWIQAKFKGQKPSAEVLYQQITTPGVNFRERIIAASLISDEDIQTLQKEGKLTEARATWLHDFKESRKKAAAEAEDKIPDELKGLGFMGLLEKLIEKLTKLMEKLTGQLDKAFAKKSDQFDVSPIGGDQKYTLEKPGTGEQGINLRAEKSGQEVKAVTGGKVAEVGPNYVKVQVGEGFIIYGGLVPAVKKDEEIAKGAQLGVMKTELLNFQMVNKDGKQIDPTKMLGNEKFLKSAEKKAEAPELKMAQPPIALAGDAKLNVAKNFTQTGSTGIKITAAKDTAVVMMADGIITQSANGIIEVTHKDGKVMKFTGLKNDTSLHAANANEVVKAGVAIGAVGDTGVLGIQVIENGTQTDPAALLANYLPTTPAPASAAAQDTTTTKPNPPAPAATVSPPASPPAPPATTKPA